MFGGAKKKKFVTEIRELHHLASHDWIVDSFSISGSKTYIQTKEECSTCKKIGANQEITHEIVDELGKNIKLKAMCRYDFLPKPSVNQSTY